MRVATPASGSWARMRSLINGLSPAQIVYSTSVTGWNSCSGLAISSPVGGWWDLAGVGGRVAVQELLDLVHRGRVVVVAEGVGALHHERRSGVEHFVLL